MAQMNETTYRWLYKTPEAFSNILMNSDGKYLTGLCFVDSKVCSKHNFHCQEKFLPIFKETIEWLDIYFCGKSPNFIPEYRIKNITPFRKEVIDILCTIPYGQTLSYGDIAKNIAKRRGIVKMSSRAVGGAVGWNPIVIIIPCHRVIGSKGALTGYGGGLENKISLLKLEGSFK